MKQPILIAAVATGIVSCPLLADGDTRTRQAQTQSSNGENAIIADRSLMITDLGVVEDPKRTNALGPRPGPWSFRHLIEQMAGDNDPSQFALRWLEQWQVEQQINGHRVAARPSIRELIIDPWIASSGGERLDLSLAPFRLLAIVNRMDLREHAERRVNSAGEGRFVFGVVTPDGEPLPPLAGPAPGGFLMIFEYDLVAKDMDDLRRWAEDWRELSAFEPGATDFNERLERITRRFTDAGRGRGRPNASALNQVRTNEIALNTPWELREFVLDHRNGLLRQHSVALTPDTVALNGTQTLAELINANQDQLLDGRFELPSTWFGSSSLSGPFVASDFPNFERRTFTVNPIVDTLIDVPWSAEGVESNEARHALALNTCNGCHRDETANAFIHVGFPDGHSLPESLGMPAQLSGFLTGVELIDPVDHQTPRRFADLDRRAEDLASLLDEFEKDSRGPSHRQKARFVH